MFISHLASFAKYLPKVPFSSSTCITPQCPTFPVLETAVSEAEIYDDPRPRTISHVRTTRAPFHLRTSPILASPTLVRCTLRCLRACDVHTGRCHAFRPRAAGMTWGGGEGPARSDVPWILCGEPRRNHFFPFVIRCKYARRNLPPPPPRPRPDHVLEVAYYYTQTSWTSCCRLWQCHAVGVGALDVSHAQSYVGAEHALSVFACALNGPTW